MCNPKTVDAQSIAAAHWNPLPEWVERLASYCNEHTQVAAAKKIGRSASLINQVLRGNYKGDMEAVKSRVETALMAGGITCPILGAISGSQCLQQQAKPYNSGNHLAVSLFRECRRCPNNKGRAS
ncbi:MAG: hypothetical protein FJX23_03035 [Alphaproteobacteria bacterium]|nr:hypothetical protein [Alphaproteobacteria bacterium]